jgi:hypothetical protein
MRGVFSSNVATAAAVTATGTNGANGVESTGQIGVRGISYSTGGVGISGTGATGVDGIGDSTTGTGISGLGNIGVSGRSYSTNGVGVIGFGAIGVDGRVRTSDGTGVRGHSDSGTGVQGQSNSGTGVEGHSIDGVGIIAQSANAIGLHALGGGAAPTTPSIEVAQRAAIYAESSCDHIVGQSVAIYGISHANGTGGGIGVFGSGEEIGVWGHSETGVAGNFFTLGKEPAGKFFSAWGHAAQFEGSVLVEGKLEVLGLYSMPGGGFKIDHPLDPENKYLYHSSVESPDMLNIYNGNTITHANGDATIMLPDYFEALNHDFRYQLTVIGQFAQAIVAEEIRNNQFTIKTDQPNIRVSWQVTGVRKDPFANMRRIVVEEDKPADERGLYLHPEAHGKPETQSIRSLREKQLRTRGGQGAP